MNKKDKKIVGTPSFKDLYMVWEKSDHSEPEADLQYIIDYLMKYSFTLDMAKDLAYNLIEGFKKKSIDMSSIVDTEADDSSTMEDTPLEERGIFLSKLDIKIIQEAIDKIGHSPLTKEEFQRISLLTAFAAYARTHPHPKKWIRCSEKDKQKIYNMAGFAKNMPTKEKLTLTAYMHSMYGMNMRVIGSTKPTPCYLFDWQEPEEFANLIKIGEVNDKEVIKKYLENLIAEKLSKE